MWGAAIEVPENSATPPFGVVDNTATPCNAMIWQLISLWTRSKMFTIETYWSNDFYTSTIATERGFQVILVASGNCDTVCVCVCVCACMRTIVRDCVLATFPSWQAIECKHHCCCFQLQ